MQTMRTDFWTDFLKLLVQCLVFSLSLTGALQAQSDKPTTGVCKVLDKELESGRYVGACLDGFANDPNGQVSHGQVSYKGGFVAGRRQGQGVMRYAIGDLYDGSWLAGQRSGDGRFVFGPGTPWAGDMYRGQWKEDKMHGFGKYIWANGEYTSGEWLEGMQSGHRTGGQARREAYLKYFLEVLPQTKNRVCTAQHVTEPYLVGAVGVVQHVLGDRLLIQLDSTKQLIWQWVSNWRPCAT
jgi:hypothetical protein